MNDIQPKLTPELVSLAIESGILDNSLPALANMIRSRKEVLAARKAYDLTRGDRFITKDISPKKFDGLTVTFLRHEGKWLVCELDEADARYIHNYRLPGEVSPIFRELKLRQSHVGTVFTKPQED